MEMSTDDAKTPSMPVVKSISLADLKYALASGLRDFRAEPVFGLVISGLFVLAGILILLQLTVWGSNWLILPVAIGFPLIGPFVVVGLYEVSHQIEQKNIPTWAEVVRVIFSQKDRQIPSMCFVVLFFFGIWFYMAHLIFALFFGLSALTNITSSYDVLFSLQGLTMLAVGSAVGGALAFILYSITVVSIPLIVDRDVDFVTAMITSFSAVLTNLPVMLVWGAVIGTLTVLAMIPLFLGLLIVLPVLGHATWHLYRRVLEPM